MEAVLQEEREQSHSVIYRRIRGEMVRKTAIVTKEATEPSGIDANTWQKLLKARKNPMLITDFREEITKLARKMWTEDHKFFELLISNSSSP